MLIENCLVIIGIIAFMIFYKKTQRREEQSNRKELSRDSIQNEQVTGDGNDVHVKDEREELGDEETGDANKEAKQEPGISEEGEEIKRSSVVNDFADKMLRDESLRKRRRSSHGCYCLFHSLLKLLKPAYNGRE